MNLCKCGMEHKSDTKNIIVGRNALQRLTGIVQEGGFKHITLVADVNTYPLAGEKVKSLLPGADIKQYLFEDEELIPDETAIGKLLTATTEKTDLILTIGSGTLNDLSRYISGRLGIPYIIIGTAPSMDGYASLVSPLIISGLKVTLDSIVAHSIIGDTEILKTAPVHMVGAGLGDMLGKFNTKSDWLLANLVEDEYYCDYIAGIVEEAVAKCIQYSGGIRQKDDETVNSIMDGLILSGVAMSYANSSRPASGAEHHISHFWEVMFLLEGKKAVLHGIKVGIGSLVMIKLHEMFLNEQPDWDRAYKHAETLSFEKYKADVEKVYGRASGEIVDEERRTAQNSYENTVRRINIYKEKWDQIKQIVEENKQDYAYMESLLSDAGCPVTPPQVGVDRQMFINSIIYGKEVRHRYTILHILGDMGLLPEYAEKLADIYYTGN